MTYKFLKILLFLSLLFFVQNCGYQPLLTEQYQKFTVTQFNITGDRKLGQQLANKFGKIEGVKNNVIFNINATKQKGISSRSSSGTILEYNLNLNFLLEVVSRLDNKKVFKKNFSETSSYKASDVHLDTLNRERKIIDDMVKNISNQITTQLNLIYKSK